MKCRLPVILLMLLVSGCAASPASVLDSDATSELAVPAVYSTDTPRQSQAISGLPNVFQDPVLDDLVGHALDENLAGLRSSNSKRRDSRPTPNWGIYCRVSRAVCPPAENATILAKPRTPIRRPSTSVGKSISGVNYAPAGVPCRPRRLRRWKPLVRCGTRSQRRSCKAGLTWFSPISTRNWSRLD